LRVEDLSGTVVLMLPLAFSVGMLLNSILLWISFEKDFRGFSRNLFGTFMQSLTGSVFAGFVAYLLLQMFDKYVVFSMDTLAGVFLQGFCAGVAGLFAGAIFLIVLRNKEIVEVLRALRHKVWKFRPTTVDQEELLG
jgi:hypothetical protein